ncbi:MAG: hypothetical protein ACYSOF_10620 [Planctomycetota bacterium]|jgi:hypothetical protein
MKTCVEFRTDKFPPYKGEEEEINPDRWGKRLAEYIEQKLNAKGIKTGEMYTEDWGWALPIENDDFSMWIGCGNYLEWPDGFLCFVESKKPFVRKWFLKIDTREKVGRVVGALDKILTSDPDIRDIRWWEENEK